MPHLFIVQTNPSCKCMLEMLLVFAQFHHMVAVMSQADCFSNLFCRTLFSNRGKGHKIDVDVIFFPFLLKLNSFIC